MFRISLRNMATQMQTANVGEKLAKVVVFDVPLMPTVVHILPMMPQGYF